MKINPRNPAAELIGAELCAKVERAALQLYKDAADYALTRGLILADTKFEFGLVPGADGTEEELILVDEALTPDSSRYWPAAGYAPGVSASSVAPSASSLCAR